MEKFKNEAFMRWMWLGKLRVVSYRYGQEGRMVRIGLREGGSSEARLKMDLLRSEQAIDELDD